MLNDGGAKGKLIVVEGLDGCGKTTAAKRLAAEHGGIYAFEPTDGVIGRLIRQILSGGERVSARSLAVLFAADRAEHVENVIIPSLERGETIVCDRFYMSNMAYQGLDMPVEDVLALNRLALPSGFAPDLTIFLDVEPSECIRRINADPTRSSRDIYEEEGKLIAIRENYYKAIAMLERTEQIITM